jgi:hypothetical protein
MQRSGQAIDSAAQQNEIKPLPLFRPEALAAQQHKFHGQIILIRPLSLLFFGWLGIFLAACMMAFLVLGRYTEKAHVPGILLAGTSTATTLDGSQRIANFYVPSRWMARLHPGDRVPLLCRTCPQGRMEQSGTVQQISDTPLSPAEVALANVSISEPAYKITVSLTPQAARLSQTQLSQEKISRINDPPQSGVPMEAEIPLGRKPLIQWLFERPGA